jgi:hypothetical protein
MSPDVVTAAFCVIIKDLITLAHPVGIFFALFIRFLALPLATLGPEPGVPPNLTKLDFQKIDPFIISTTFNWPTFVIRFRLIRAPLV